jgi:hypothetical protein
MAPKTAHRLAAGGLWLASFTMLVGATAQGTDAPACLAWAIFIGLGATVTTVWLIVEHLCDRATESIAEAVGEVMGGQLTEQESGTILRMR